MAKKDTDIKTLLELVEDQQHMKNPQDVMDQLHKCRAYKNLNEAQANFLDEVRYVLESGLEWAKK